MQHWDDGDTTVMTRKVSSSDFPEDHTGEIVRQEKMVAVSEFENLLEEVREAVEDRAGYELGVRGGIQDAMLKASMWEELNDRISKNSQKGESD